MSGRKGLGLPQTKIGQYGAITSPPRPKSTKKPKTKDKSKGK